MRDVFLSPRLQAVADFVKQGEIVADIGTDHGYLPAYLIHNQISPFVYASDIRKGPLSAAKNTALSYNIREGIQFILADGLEGIKPFSAQTITIAGMGGETIASILEKAPWVRTPGIKLILQPQTKVDDLSNWLDNNGFAIQDICLARDAGRIYVIMLAMLGKTRAPFTCAEMFADRMLLEKRDPLLPAYLDHLIRITEKKVAGLKSAADPDPVELPRHQLALKGFYRMKRETELW